MRSRNELHTWCIKDTTDITETATWLKFATRALWEAVNIQYNTGYVQRQLLQLQLQHNILLAMHCSVVTQICFPLFPCAWHALLPNINTEGSTKQRPIKRS